MYNIIAVDFDGVLCDSKDDPIVDNVLEVNKLFNTKQNFIVIHTSRNHEMYIDLVAWLSKYGVLYNAVCMNKMKADMYLDDRSEKI